MNHFSSLYCYKYLEYIPYIKKYLYHKQRNTLRSKSFDFKFTCETSKALKKSKVFRVIKRYKLEKYFIIVCKHYYFLKFGPRLNGVCTRRIELLKKEYSSKKTNKRCCDSLILLTQEEWELPAYKKWSPKRQYINTAY